MLTLLILINLVRPVPLTTDTLLTTRAEVRAEALCQSGQWSHEGWKESFTGIPYRFAGENLGKGFGNDVDLFNAFMKSPTHKANIVKSSYAKIGIGRGSCGVVAVLFKG